MTKTTKPLNKTATAALVAVAACSMALTVGSNEIQLTPATPFRALDGRPFDKKGNRLPDWHINAALAQVVIDQAAARVTPFVIDYDHQTLRAKDNGQPAPAAGWFHKLEWREGVGLFAVDVEWTEPTRNMIAANQYKFISPVIIHDATGAVLGLLMAAITNTPAIDGMDEVLLAAASLHFQHDHTASLTLEPQMNEELLNTLRWTFNLPITATADEILVELKKVGAMITQGKTDTAAASVDLVAMITTQRETIASLSVATPDPAKFVPIGTMTALQAEVVALSNQLNGSRIDTVVKGALASGKLMPAQEAWAREFGVKDIAALTAFIESAPPLGLLAGMQSGKTAVTGAAVVALTADQVAMCAAMGQDQKQFLATLQAEATA